MFSLGLSKSLKSKVVLQLFPSDLNSLCNFFFFSVSNVKALIS